MRINVPTIDDALRRSYEEILSSGKVIADSSRGANREIVGVQIEITKPLARISRTEARYTLYSALGEFLWYLAKSDDLEFMKYYAPKYPDFVKLNSDGRVVAAYGPRLFDWDGVDQVTRLIQLLRKKHSTKQAVLQLFDRGDLAEGVPDVPCTCTLQFLCREGKLDLIAVMRSNDAVRGLPNDMFAFTMLQELIARALSLEMGIYRHWVGSLHIYEKDHEIARGLISEGWQQVRGAEMTPMPAGDPWPFVNELLKAEHSFREGNSADPWKSTGSDYWDSLIWLLEMLRHFKNIDEENAIASWKRRVSKSFDIFIEPRLQKLKDKKS